MTSKSFTQAVTELAVLPEDALMQVLDYIKILKQRYPMSAELKLASSQRYPLRGESYIYSEPFEPAVLAEAWDAVGDAK